jgi:hypothetical protein
VARAYVQGEKPKGTSRTIYAWSFHIGTSNRNRLKSGKAKQMTNVIPFKIPGAPMTTESPEKDLETAQRLPYSFDIVQVGNNVLIDACVPAAVGFKIAQLILEHSEAADAAPKSNKRRSRKATA